MIFQKYPEVLINFGGKYWGNWRKIIKLQKEVSEELKKFSENFSLNLGKVFRKPVEFQN